MKATRKAANWLWDHSEKVVRFAFHNQYVSTIDKGYDKFATWNNRPEKVSDAAAKQFASAHTAYKEAGTKGSLLVAAGRTSAWAVARVATGLGTFVVRGGLGFGTWVGARGAQLAAILPISLGAALPLAVAATGVEVVNVGALTAKAVGKFGQDVARRFRSLPGRKAAETPAVETAETEGPAAVVAAPAVEATEAPAVAAPAVAEPAAAPERPAAAQPRLVVAARTRPTSSVAGLGE